MDSGNGGAILPTWTSVDNGNVKTSRELWEAMKAQGWNVDVRAASYILIPANLFAQYHRYVRNRILSQFNLLPQNSYLS